MTRLEMVSSSRYCNKTHHQGDKRKAATNILDIENGRKPLHEKLGNNSAWYIYIFFFQKLSIQYSNSHQQEHHFIDPVRFHQTRKGEFEDTKRNTDVAASRPFHLQFYPLFSTCQKITKSLI